MEQAKTVGIQRVTFQGNMHLFGTNDFYALSKTQATQHKTPKIRSSSLVLLFTFESSSRFSSTYISNRKYILECHIG